MLMAMVESSVMQNARDFMAVAPLSWVITPYA